MYEVLSAPFGEINREQRERAAIEITLELTLIKTIAIACCYKSLSHVNYVCKLALLSIKEEFRQN